MTSSIVLLFLHMRCFSCMEVSICARLWSTLLLFPSTSNIIKRWRTCTKWLDDSHLSPRNLVIFPSRCTVKWGWSTTCAEAQSALRSDARSPNYTRLWRGMWRSQRWTRKPTSLHLVYLSDCENPSRGHGRHSWPFFCFLIIISHPAYHFFWCHTLTSQSVFQYPGKLLCLLLPTFWAVDEKLHFYVLKCKSHCTNKDLYV